MASISGLSGEVTGMGDQLLQSSQTLVAGATDANWQGSAAEQFRAQADTRSSDIRKCVQMLDTAASSIKQLASVVEQS